LIYAHINTYLELGVPVAFFFFFYLTRICGFETIKDPIDIFIGRVASHDPRTAVKDLFIVYFVG